MEPDLMAEVVGDVGGGWIIDYLRRYVGSEEDGAARRRARSDPWNVKGISALGATAPQDRVTALDTMGVDTQLVFPNTALCELRIDSAAARDACRRYNDCAV